MMELVEGERLERMRQGGGPDRREVRSPGRSRKRSPPPTKKSIVHRDLKPANVERPRANQGAGLRAGESEAHRNREGLRRFPLSTAGELADTDALTHPLFGMILGTAGYMSPEQAGPRSSSGRMSSRSAPCSTRCSPGGARSMARMCPRSWPASSIKDPDWTALPKDTPRALMTLLARCLTKDRKRRLADISDARLDLEDSASRAGGGEPQSVTTPRRSHLWLMFIAGALISAASLLLTWRPWSVAPPSVPVRWTVDLGADIPEVTRGLGMAAVMSPDGTRLAFVGRPVGPPDNSNIVRLYTRELSQLEASPLAGTDGATSPFFSPDGEWLGFFAESRLKKVSLRGGNPLTLATIVTPRGGAWAEDGSIIFAPNRAGTLMRVSSAGGTVEPVTQLTGDEVTHRWPQVLPGDSAVIYTAHNSPSGFEGAKIVAQPLRGGPPKTLRDDAWYRSPRSERSPRLRDRIDVARCGLRRRTARSTRRRGGRF